MTHLFAFLVLISAQPAHAERWCSGVITKLTRCRGRFDHRH